MVYTDGVRRRAVTFRSPTGRVPYEEFLASLRDRVGVARIRMRVLRAQRGNLGDHKRVGEGVVELRIDFGPGYRVYAGLSGSDTLVLLCAGDKSSQREDIAAAIDYWRWYRRPE